MSDISKHIIDSFLFTGVDFSEIDREFRVIENALVVEYHSGDLILSADRHTDALCIVDMGNIRITSNSGDRETVLRYAGCGEIFGAAALFSDIDHSTRVYAESDTRVIFLKKELICKLIQKSSAVAVNYISFLSGKISFLNRKVAAFTAASAEIKLAMFLAGNSDRDGNVACKTSMSSLADQLGIGRASLYRAIDALAENGLIKYNGKSFAILDRDALIQLVK